MSVNGGCFGQNLIMIRQRYKMTQEQLAERLNVTRQLIYRYENGMVHKPSVDVLYGVSELSGIPEKTLLTCELKEEDFHDLDK